jgi:hypothetical protein
MKRSILFFVLVLAIALALPGIAAAAPTLVANEGELTAALANPAVTEIQLSGDISTSVQINVSRDVVLDGAGKVITVGVALPTVNGFKHALAVYGPANVTIKNVTIDSAGKANGVNTYNGATLTLENAKLLNSRGAGLTVNGSTVSASGLVTSGNAWGAVNVDPGSGVTAVSKFTLVGAANVLNEANKIWTDGSNVTAVNTPVVVAPQYTKTAVGSTGNSFVYVLSPAVSTPASSPWSIALASVLALALMAAVPSVRRRIAGSEA